MSPNEILELQILTRANFGLLVLLYLFVAWREGSKPNLKGSVMPLVIPKTLIQSKTFWLNLIGLALVVAGYLADVVPGWAATIGAVVQVLQTLNRLLTDAPIKGLFALFVAIGLLGASVAEAGLFSNLLGRVQRQSPPCANGQCGVQSKAPSAVNPMPLPAKPSATKPVKPLAPKPPLTNEQKREAFNKAVREGRYGEILVGNDFTPGGNDFDGPVDYIPVSPPKPKVK